MVYKTDFFLAVSTEPKLDLDACDYICYVFVKSRHDIVKKWWYIGL